MKKSKWVLSSLSQQVSARKATKTTSLFNQLKTKYDKAKYHVDQFETRFARPILKEIVDFGSTLKKDDISLEFKDLIANSEYLLAYIKATTCTGIDDDYEAFVLLQDALLLKPDFKEASDLKKSLEMENHFFKYRESNAEKKQ